MDEKKKNIAQVRQRIDDIDTAMLTLLQERLDCALTIGRLKKEANLASWDPRREREVYKRLLADNQQKFPENALRSIFHEIMTTCRLAQKDVEVAFLGPEATFSHLAAVRYFGPAAQYRPVASIEDAFLEVEKGRVQYGIVPVENSIEGSIALTLDSFMKYKVSICGELHLSVRQNLVCSSGNLKDIQIVASHAQPLAQCREWLRKNLLGISTLEVSSTAAAAKMAADNPNIGAIASELAVKHYEVQIAVPGIEDHQGNTTRFLVIGSHAQPRSGSDKTSLLLGTADKPGALNEALSILSAKNINLTKLESRPVKGKRWKYQFFLDMLGHSDDQIIQEACTELQHICPSFRLLGSYPKAADPEAEHI
ncbi:prephenate dehydratase [Desulfobulbus sp. F5]|nr:prephenate dehydratase [Desulfobulbus sp. F5]